MNINRRQTVRCVIPFVCLNCMMRRIPSKTHSHPHWILYKSTDIPPIWSTSTPNCLQIHWHPTNMVHIHTELSTNPLTSHKFGPHPHRTLYKSTDIPPNWATSTPNCLQIHWHPTNLVHIHTELSTNPQTSHQFGPYPHRTGYKSTDIPPNWATPTPNWLQIHRHPTKLGHIHTELSTSPPTSHQFGPHPHRTGYKSTDIPPNWATSSPNCLQIHSHPTKLA